MLFDLGGTLVDESDFGGLAELAKRLYLDLDADEIAHVYREVELEHDERPPPGDREQRQVEFWRAVLSGASGQPVGREGAERFRLWLTQESAPVRLYSDARRCLDALDAQGRALAVVSNSTSEARLRQLLDQVGILRYFARIVSSGTEGVAKPDPEIFRRTVERLKIAPGEALHVGNLLHTDARAASAAGLHALWLHRYGTGYGPEPMEITSLLEVAPWVHRYEHAR